MADRCLKRCLSASDLPEPQAENRADRGDASFSGSSKGKSVQKRYRGRYSLQKSPVSAGGIRSRRRLFRQRSPKRRSEYLEDLEEYQQYNWSNTNDAGSSQSSSSLQIPSPNKTLKGSGERLMPFDDALMPETHAIAHSRSAPNAGSCLAGEGPIEYLKHEVYLLENRSLRPALGYTPSPFLLGAPSSTTAAASFGDTLWLQLQAYFAGRPVADRQHVSESITAHGLQLAKLRKERSAALHEIKEFRLDDFIIDSPVSSTSHNPIELVYSPSYSEHMRLSVARVDVLFERLDSLIQLYPTAKAMQLDSAHLWDESLEQRIATLNMWSGTVKDLVGKISEAGNYLGLIEGSLAKYTASHSSLTTRTQVFSSPASPLSSPQHLTLPHTPASDDWRQTTELWPDNSFFSARAVAERLSRSSSTSSPHTGTNNAPTATHSGHLDVGTSGNHSHNHNHQNHSHGNNQPPHSSASFTVHICSESFTGIYYKVVGKSLRLRGMIEVLRRLEAVCRRSLDKALLTLLVPRKYAQIVGLNEAGRFLAELRKRYDLKNDGATVNSAEFMEMNLPSFLPHFLFLARMPLDLVHQWLKMRADRVVSPEWDLMTLNTLIEDSHDCMETAIDVKERFINMVELSTTHASEQLSYLESFDEKLETIFENYLSYARCWAQTAALRQSAESDWQEYAVGKLDAEWLSAKRWSANVNRGEITAARRFCEIASDLLTCMVLSYMDEKFDLVDSKLVEVRDEEDEYILINDGESLKHSSIYVLCRNFKEMIKEMRRRLLMSLSFARKICNDLEICARYAWNDGSGSVEETAFSKFFPSSDKLIDRLVESGHIVVKFLNHFEPQTNEECPFFVLCNREIVNDFEYIDNLLNATYQSVQQDGGEEGSTNKANTPPSQHGSKGYLILVPTMCSRRRIDDFSHHMVSMRLSFLTKCTMAHYISSTNGIYLICESRQALEHSRRRFELAAGDFVPHGRLELVDDFCSCNDELSSALSSLKSLAFKTMHESWTHARGLGHFILNGRRISELKPTERSCVRVTLLQAWEAIFESYRELSEIVSLRYHQQFYNETLELVSEWSKFFIEATSNDWTNTGHAPVKWAVAPLKCLAEMPSRLFHSRVLSPTEKEVLSDTIHHCVSHLRALEEAAAAYGAERHSALALSTPLSHSASDPSATTSPPIRQDSSSLGNSLAAGVGALSFGDLLRRRPAAVRERINSAVRVLEGTRDEAQRAERRIGRVAESRPPKDFHTFFPHKMRVPFEWQRLENKELGAGSFGRVFLVMNLKDKCLMAVKQIRVQRENNSALRALVDEVDILRQLDHSNLVKYYGVEVHKEEILIFMEYCSAGTLLRVCKEGLDVDCVRQYTYYLLLAIAYLHDHSIVHRDVKPENVFLAQKNVLKLGDFGCSLRLRESRTQVGEVVHHVGTTRYMAPEMQTSGGQLDDEARRQMREGSQQSSGSELNLYVGYGRGVDIWALACVVVEMLTGKKPYHEMHNEFQIIYHIGLGNAPRIPEDIRKCQMSYSFLQAAFRIDPRERPTARELLQHPFANIMPHQGERDSLD